MSLQGPPWHSLSPHRVPEDREGLGKRWLESSGAGWAASLLPSAGPMGSQEQCKQCYICCLPPQDKYLTNCCLPSITWMKGEGNQLDFWQGLQRWYHVSQTLITPKALTPPAVLCRASPHVGSKLDASGGLHIYCEERAVCSMHMLYVHCVPDTHSWAAQSHSFHEIWGLLRKKLG